MKILITGARGQLGSDCLRVFRPGHEVVAVDLPEVDIGHAAGVQRLVDDVRPDWIVNCAAFTDVDGCERERDEAWRVNAEGPRCLAEAAARHDARLLHLSTDYVFDGQRPPPSPYREEDKPGPRSWYGETKLAGERAVADVTDRFAIVRTAWLYGLHGRNFLKTMKRLAEERPPRRLRVVHDQHGCPTWSDRLARQLAIIIENDLRGVYHAAGGGHCTWFELASYFLAKSGIPHDIEPCTTAEYPRAAVRPGNSILENAALERIGLNRMPPWEQDVDLFTARLMREGGA